MRMGAVMLPAPTPVTPMARAMRKPARNSIKGQYTLLSIKMEDFCGK
jgi:hypothetical protein